MLLLKDNVPTRTSSIISRLCLAFNPIQSFGSRQNPNPQLQNHRCVELSKLRINILSLSIANMRPHWLLLKTIALLENQCEAFSIDRQQSFVLKDTTNPSAVEQRIKVPGRNAAHFIGNPLGDILTINIFNDNIMSRLLCPNE